MEPTEEKRLTIEEIECLPEEEFDALPEGEKQRYFDWMNRENFPTPWEFYGYAAELEPGPDNGDDRDPEVGVE